VGRGRHAEIDVDLARAQLRKNLDAVQGLGANGKARVTGPLKVAAVRPVPAPEAREEPPSPPLSASPQTVAAEALKSVLGIDEPTFQQAAKDGIIIRAGRDRYELIRSIRNFTTSLREASQP